jgi:hypothetical protein
MDQQAMTKLLTYVEIDVPDFAASSPEQIVTYRFAVPTDYLPNTIDAIPSIETVSFQPALLSLGESLGQRAALKLSFVDHQHIFAGEPFDQGSFWGKWRGRYGTKLRGRNIRLIRGQLGQTIDQMETRHYILETTDGPTPDARYMIEAKDPLKFLDDDRAQAPVLSNGKLAGSIDAVTTSASLSPTGIGDLEYPASGWVCISGKEVCAFTRSGDGLTITRGEFGSVAQTHDAGDRVQLVKRFGGDDAADIIEDLITNYTDTPAGYINLAEWQAETAANLGVIYARTICEPTGVKKLISELIQQAALALWWDDLAQKIRLQVLREISTDADTFGEDRILAGSLTVKEQPGKRISQIWSYYGQRDPTDGGAKEDGYRAALATVDLDTEAAYGLPAVTKLQCPWIETLSAAERLNQIQLSRYRDPPRNFAFALAFNEAVTLAGGYQLSWWANQDATGLKVPAKIQITKIARLPDRIEIEAEEMLASGVIVLTHTVLLNAPAGLQSWTVPATWNDADNSIETIGAGAAGASNSSSQAGGKGGGGGGYAKITNLALTPSSSVSYQVGAKGVASAGNAGGNGTDSWFNGASLGASSVGAKGGLGGSGSTSSGTGGQAASGVGTLKTSGGNGGNGGTHDGSRAGGGGGGGAGGPNGDGGDGANGATDSNPGRGGGGADGGENGQDIDGGDNRFNFGGGTASSPTGQQGGGGRGGQNGSNAAGPGGTGEQLWTQTEAPVISAGPGGGGGGGAAQQSGAPGGKYGGGGGGKGGSGPIAGDGTDGVIAIQWREAS